MAKDSPIPLPGDDNLVAWAMANPQAIRRALELLNILSDPEVRLVRVGGARLGKGALIVTPEGALLSLPVNWAAGVPANLSGSATLADVIAKVNLMLNGERGVQSQ